MGLPNFVTKTINFARRVALDIKDLRTRIGLLPYLTTTNKTSLVEAVNEVNGYLYSLNQQYHYNFNFLELINQPLNFGSDVTFGYVTIQDAVNNNHAVSLGQLHGWGIGTETTTVLPNLNTPVKGGIYSISASSNAPFVYGNIIKMRRATDEGTEIAVDVFGNNMAFRSEVGGNYYPWKYVLHTGNLGQLTVNTTADLVGGYVYLPNGNVTTTFGLATHVLNAIADGQTAFNWGDHSTVGYVNLGQLNGWGIGTETTTVLPNLNTPVKGGIYSISASSNAPFVYGNIIKMRRATDEGTEIAVDVFGNNMAFRSEVGGNYYPWKYVLHTGNLGQLTVNTTADLVGGYVYLPNGNVTTTFGLATHVLNAIADGQAASQSLAYAALSNNIKTVGNGWQTYVGGRFNQALGDKITIKGNNLNYIGFNLVGSGAFHVTLGSFNVNNGVFNNVVGNYNSANANRVTLLGNNLYSTAERQSVYGNYNKPLAANDTPSLHPIHVFASGKSEYEKDNAVIIYDDNSTSFRGRAYYADETRNEEWFNYDHTLVDVKAVRELTQGRLSTVSTDYNLCEYGYTVVAVRTNTSLSSDSQFHSIQPNNALGVYAVAYGVNNTDADTERMNYKNSFYVGQNAQNALENIVNSNPYLVVILDPKSFDLIGIKYLDAALIIQYRQNGATLIIIGSYVKHEEKLYFEFNQQTLM